MSSTPSSSLNQDVNFTPTITDNYPFLKQLAKTHSLKKRKRILKTASSDQLLGLVEICLNILQNRFRLTARQKNRLIPFAHFLRQLARIRSEKGARKLVVQKGSGLPLALFPSLLTPIILEVARTLFTKNTESNQ